MDTIDIFHNKVNYYEYGNTLVCLDSCAGESIFKSRNLYNDFKISNEPLIVRGVNNDSEDSIVSEEGTTEFGIVYYNKSCVANVLSLGNAVDKFYL